MGMSKGGYIKIERGENQLTTETIARAAKVFNVDPGHILSASRLAPLVGYVGAGAEAHLFSEGQGPFDMVDAPDGSTENTVAVEIRGESLGSFFDSWLVFYDDVRDPVTSDLLGKLCVCGLPDGRVVIKKLAKSREKGLFILHSQFEPPIYDVAVIWAAKVKNMVPR